MTQRVNKEVGVNVDTKEIRDTLHSILGMESNKRADEVILALCDAVEGLRDAKKALYAEIDAERKGNAEIRREYGAKSNETLRGFVARLHEDNAGWQKKCKDERASSFRAWSMVDAKVRELLEKDALVANLKIELAESTEAYRTMLADRQTTVRHLNAEVLHRVAERDDARAEVARLREKLGEKVCSKCGKPGGKYQVVVDAKLGDVDRYSMFADICPSCIDNALAALRK